jgi:hypothetical protein
VGTAASGGGKLDAGDFDFKAAVLRVVVFADAVCEVDEGAAVECKLGCAGREVPSDSADGGAGANGKLIEWRGLGLSLGEFEADVPFLHNARLGDKARAEGKKNRLWVAVTERLKTPQPASQDRGDAVERQFGVNLEEVLGLARDEMLLGMKAESAAELGQGGGRHSEADGEGMAAEAGEKIRAGFKSIEELEAVHGAAGAVGDTILHADDYGGLGGALDDARGKDADDAAVPSFSIDNEQRTGG